MCLTMGSVMNRTKNISRLLSTAGTAALLLTFAQAALADDSGIELVVVTATRVDATEIKKQAPIVLDAYSLEQIRQLPDANAAELLQRVPGVQLESDSGEGRFVNIRGLDADLNGTTFDGVHMTASNQSSPQGGARAVAFDAFPSGILGGVEVYKSLNPEMDAEGLGGVVNLLPRTIPAGQDHILDLGIGGGVESLRGSPVYKTDLTVGKRFFNDKMSVVFSYAYEQDRRGIDDIEEDYAYANDGVDVPAGTSAHLQTKEFDNLQYRWYKYSRERQGYGGTWTYDLDSNSELYLRGIHAGYTETAWKHELIIKNLGHDISSVNNTTGDFTDTAASPSQKFVNSNETIGNDLVEFGGHTLLWDLVKADARVSWTKGSDVVPYSISSTFKGSSVALTYNNLDPNLPTASLIASGLNNPATFTKFSGSVSNSNNSDEEYAGVANFSLPLDVIGDNGVLKFGASERSRTRDAAEQGSADQINNGYTYAGFAGATDVVYYNNHFDIGPQVNFNTLRTIAVTPFSYDPTTFENDSETVTAGYVQYSTSFGKVDVIGGVRIEGTDGTYRANTATTDALGNTVITPNTTKSNYTNVFPDISFKYQPRDNLQFRGAFSTAIARPGFNQLSAAESVDLTGAFPVISQGNPNLKPTTGDNIDLTASYFLPHAGIASIGAFYKSFSNYIIANSLNGVTNFPGYVGTPVTYNTFSNIGSAQAEGVEVAYTQQFDGLPDFLNGLGFDGNATYVASSGQIRPGETHQLPQTSPLSFNAGIFYSHGPVFMKLSSSYVSTNLWVVGGDPTTDQYSQARFRLDFGGSYDVTDNVQAYVDVKNITNTHLEFTYTKSKDLPLQNEFYDADFLFGVRIKM